MDAQQPLARAFISYTQPDKSIARRVRRRLAAHGIDAWLDERDLRVGAGLGESLRQHIERADFVLVVASRAAADSDWVQRELAFAREHRKPVVPLFVDALQRHPLFADHKGFDAISRESFADALHALTAELFRALDLQQPAADPAQLEGGLEQIVREEPGLAPLVGSGMNDVGLFPEVADKALGAPFHPLDELLELLFELKPNRTTADLAADAFRLAGAGARPLAGWIAATGNGRLQLVTAVGRPLEPVRFDAALQLLRACNPPNDHALYCFIDANARHLDARQREAVIGMITWPVRESPIDDADLVAWEASQHFGGPPLVQEIWQRWIRDGHFDGRPCSPEELASFLADAARERLPGWDRIDAALRQHVRSCARSGDRTKVYAALDHVVAAADADLPVLEALVAELRGATGSAEWKKWVARDPEAAERMWCLIHSHLEEVGGERDWLRADTRADDMAATRAKARAKRPPPSS